MISSGGSKKFLRATFDCLGYINNVAEENFHTLLCCLSFRPQKLIFNKPDYFCYITAFIVWYLSAWKVMLAWTRRPWETFLLIEFPCVSFTHLL